MEDAEYGEIQEAAEAARLTVSAWVRQVLRAARAQSSNRDAEGGVPPADAPRGGTGPAERLAVGAEPDPASLVASPAAAGLVRAVMERHGFTEPERAVIFALRRAAEPEHAAPRLLELRGSGWPGSLDDLRGERGSGRDPSDPGGDAA